MLPYLLKRLLLLIPTLLGILALTFLIIQFVPGGPVEQLMAELSGSGAAAEAASGVPAPRGYLLALGAGLGADRKSVV